VIVNSTPRYVVKMVELGMRIRSMKQKGRGGGICRMLKRLNGVVETGIQLMDRVRGGSDRKRGRRTLCS
jgi:hypothetical protein